MGGAERVMASLHQAFPQAPIYVSATDYARLLSEFHGLIFDAPVAGTLNIQKVGSDPIALTKTSFQAGSNANCGRLEYPSDIRSSVAKINITEAAK